MASHPTTVLHPTVWHCAAPYCLAHGRRDWYFIAEQPAPAPHLAPPEGPAALTHMRSLLCSVSAALARCFRMDSISTSYLLEIALPYSTKHTPRYTVEPCGIPVFLSLSLPLSLSFSLCSLSLSLSLSLSPLSLLPLSRSLTLKIHK